MKKFSLVAFTGILLPLFGLAHEGHGVTNGFTITHYFVEPAHVMYTLGVVLAGVVYASYFRTKKKKAAK